MSSDLEDRAKRALQREREEEVRFAQRERLRQQRRQDRKARKAKKKARRLEREAISLCRSRFEVEAEVVAWELFERASDTGLNRRPRLKVAGLPFEVIYRRSGLFIPYCPECKKDLGAEVSTLAELGLFLESYLPRHLNNHKNPIRQHRSQG